MVTSRLKRLLRRSYTRGLPPTVVLAISFTFAPPTRADAVVTLCQSDSQSGNGVNLQQALLASPTNQVNKITFQCNGPATIQITAELEIRQPTFIDGARKIVLDGGGLHNMFVSGQNSTALFLVNLTMHNARFGCAQPGPPPPPCWGTVATGMSLRISHSRIENCGAAIYATPGSTLEVADTQFFGSSIISAATQTTIMRSSFQGGTAIVPGGTVSIVAGGNVTITGSTILNSGVGLFQAPCQLSIDHTTFQQNTTAGALSIGCNSTSISNSLFASNAGSNGGAISFTSTALGINLRAVRFLGNNASGEGGAIALTSATGSNRKMMISYSKFAANKATKGGGAIAVLRTIGSGGITSISARVVDFSHNVASEAGGAIFGLDTGLGIARGIFADNKAGSAGGAVFVLNLPQIHSIFANTLFVRNEAITGSAFIGDDADLINTTVDSNVGVAIGVTAPAQRKPAHIQFTNTIVSNNAKGGCTPTGAALFDDGGHNLQFPGVDCGASIAVANPHLDTMYIPLPKSPPMGNGDLSVCMSPPINGRDVYGVGRPSGGACTIGAAEGDIQVLVNRRPREGPKGGCDCGLSLLKQLQRLLPFSR